MKQVRIANKLSSIHVKLFFGFWLIVIISITATRIISSHLAADRVQRPAHPGDERFLQRMIKITQNMPPASLEAFVANHKKRGRRTLFAKELISNNVVSNSKYPISELTAYIKKNSLSNIVSIEFPFARLTGPVLVNIADKNYQLYVAEKHRHHSFERYLLLLPIWVRLTIVLFISFILCWFLARSFSKPLKQMEKAVVKLGEGDLSSRVEKADNRNDEIGSLAKTFNQMAKKLEVSQSAQQRLLADVSHELRSPMTRLQLALAMLQKPILQQDEQQKYLERCEKEVTRLDEMISDVLSLSRFENTLYQLSLQVESLEQVLKLIVQDAQFIAQEKNICIKVSDVPEALINIDSQVFASAVNNVLINAIKYSDDGKDIQVNCCFNNEEVSIAIIDSGPGVPEDALKNLFEPFYRVSNARDRKTGGTGLGLAIAKQAIIAHNGKIVASNNNENGLKITIKLPIYTEIDNINHT